MVSVLPGGTQAETPSDLEDANDEKARSKVDTECLPSSADVDLVAYFLQHGLGRVPTISYRKW